MRARPLSPHLQVYRWQLTMLLSIAHRASGVALSVGALGLVAWLLAVAAGPAAYAQWQALAGSLPGQTVLFLMSMALVYHLLNGLRHLLWDTGRAMDIPSVYRTGYTVLVLTVVLTSAIWAVALSGGAA
ncbi:MAG: succinate dehydrogenase, cytochrome b556 subunit [Xanthomonadaceae bacterium]|nr:succinate dehydrogenase, cytochrome b556 subunit [Xanthomonadaceae bacterium]